MSSPRNSLDKKQDQEFVEDVDLKESNLAAHNDPYGFAQLSPEALEDKRSRLVKTLDRRVLPCLTVMYFLNFVDRSNLSNARLGSLEADLGMKGTDFNLATSILFVGYILFQLPSNLLLTRVRPSLFLAFFMGLWGVVSLLTAFAKTFTHLLVIRFFLGVVEAPFFPGAMFVMSSWYSRDELGKRYAFFYAGSALANMFNGLLSSVVLSQLDGRLGHAGWSWLYIIEGAITVGWCFAAVFMLPDYPSTTKWLSPEDRAYASWRLARDVNADDDSTAVGLWQSVKMALSDWKIYLFIVMQHCNLLSQSFTYVFPSIVSTLGYNPTITSLLTAPPWLAAFLSCLVVTFHASKTGQRAYYVTGCMAIAAVGHILLFATTATAGRYLGMFLLTMGTLPAFQIILTYISNSFPRPMAKRAATVAIINMLGNISSTYGTFLYPKSDAPRYLLGSATMVGIAGLCGLLALTIRYVLAQQNKELDRAESVDTSSDNGETEEETKMNRRQGRSATGAFRYLL